jgi:Uma2 family endonuclease
MVSEPAGKLSHNLTWQDYREWADDERWEIVGGEAFAMSPAPTTRHQRIVTQLTRSLEEHFSKKQCDVFVAPTDVKLSDIDVVQPDLLVVCDKDKIKPTHIEGAPSLVIEVLSPSTSGFDRIHKLPLYAVSGVREVWLVTPYPYAVEVFVLHGEHYMLMKSCEKQGKLNSEIFPELTIDLEKLFDFPLTQEEQAAVVKEKRTPYGSKSS